MTSATALLTAGLLGVTTLASCKTPQEDATREDRLLAAASIAFRPAATPTRVTPFELRRGDGSAVTEADLLGRWHLVMVGYTSCPDVCPTSLRVAADALDVLERRHGMADVGILFVAVDRARDRGPRLTNYARFHHRRMTAVSGDRAAIDRVVKDLGASYSLRPDGGVDHSTALFVVDPEGVRVGAFARATTPTAMAETVARLRRARGGVEVTDAWVRAAPADAPALGAYFTVRNHGKTPVTIVGVTSPAAPHAHLHVSRRQRGRATMEAVASVTVPPRAARAFAPGGHHVMLMAPRKVPAAGEHVPLVLRFESGQALPLTARVRRRAP